METHKARSSATDQQQVQAPRPCALLAHTKQRDEDARESQVAQFYNDRCVLLTGASGFLGKLIIEKLLRTCTGLRKIFVLIRPKRSQSARARLEAIFESPIFDLLKTNHHMEPHGTRSSFEELRRKVVLLPGELTEPMLGLSIERLLQLADECSVVLHAAAVVSFDGKLRRALVNNLVGTRNVLHLATQLPHLRALVHISTCYSNCPQRQVGEHVYPVNVDPQALIEIAETLDDDALETMAANLLGEHPNYYAYTKHLAEYLCAQYASGAHQLPLVVCRPSIIVSTYEEPLRAFLDNRNAGNGMFDAISRGLMRTVHGSPETIMDLVPADFVVNCVLALGWFCDLYQRVRLRLEAPAGRPLTVGPEDERARITDALLEQRALDFYAERRRNLRLAAIQLALDENLIQMPVFHVSSGVENPITFHEMFTHIAKHTLEFPSSQLFRTPRCEMHESSLVHKLCAFVQHTCVGRLLDWTQAPPAQQVAKRSSSWAREFERVDKFNGVLPYFYLNSFKFQPDNRLALLEVFMNECDRCQFNCDIRQVNWDAFARDITLGIRQYLVGEPESTLPEARARLSTTLWRNSLMKLAVVILISYALLVLVGY